MHLWKEQRWNLASGRLTSAASTEDIALRFSDAIMKHLLSLCYAPHSRNWIGPTNARQHVSPPPRLMGDVDNEVIISTIWVYSYEDIIRDHDPHQQELFSIILEMEGRTSEEVVFEQRPEGWGRSMQSAGVHRRTHGSEFRNICEIWAKHPLCGAQLRRGTISTLVPNQRLPNTSHGVQKIVSNTWWIHITPSHGWSSSQPWSFFIHLLCLFSTQPLLGPLARAGSSTGVERPALDHI